MKRFIRYLYEYEQGRRLRNVGFIKVEQGQDDCIVHIHGKGLHMRGERKLTIYLFYVQGDGCVGIWQGTVDNVNPAINYQLHYTKDDVGVPENFSQISGILMENESGHRYAALWDDRPINIGNMRLLGPGERIMQEEAPMAEQPETKAPMAEQPEAEASMEEQPEADESGEEQPETEAPTEEQPEAENLAETQECEMAEARDRGREAQRESGRFSCSKIQRCDLAKLPRCEWKLANNNFLLHGCYNYHHLTLIDDGEQLRLGVPGIYHTQEAKAAAAFGFPEFIRIEDLQMELDREEQNAQEQFGYWCRLVRKPRQM